MKFDSNTVQERYKEIHPICIEIAKEMDAWLKNLDKTELYITCAKSTKKEDEKLKRISSSHLEGRAFDVRISDWNKNKLILFCTSFGDKYRHLGAISKVSGKRMFLVWREHGTGPHLHLQIGKDIVLKYSKNYPTWRI